MVWIGINPEDGHKYDPKFLKFEDGKLYVHISGIPKEELISGQKKWEREMVEQGYFQRQEYELDGNLMVTLKGEEYFRQLRAGHQGKPGFQEFSEFMQVLSGLPDADLDKLLLELGEDPKKIESLHKGVKE